MTSVSDRMCFLWWVLLCPIFAQAAGSELRVRSLPVPGGSELITVFGEMPEAGEVPLVSILRDSLGDGDPQNDRLRYIWVLTSTGPGILQRAAGSLPFFYWRADIAHDPDRLPAPVLDLGAPARPVWHALAGSAAQLIALDPNGALVRSSTRSYRNNLSDQHRVRLLQGLAVISELEDQPGTQTTLSDAEVLEIETRLTLGSQLLGGLVRENNLPEAYAKERAAASETRGHNWELLRQRAEANGLYFQPLGDDGSPTHALLWIATEDIRSHRKFDGEFLGITDPFRDSRLVNWKGYREVRDGKEMIPLALYALEYPKVPLLLVDFRDPHSPKTREMIRHAFTDTVTGVLGISKFGNWPYLAGSMAFNFVRIRHGATNNRAARLKAYAEVRQWLALDDSIDPGLRHELQRRLDLMGVNPMESSAVNQAKIARRQYAALLRYATDPNGLAERVARDRNSELSADRHSLGALTGFRIAHLATLGLWGHHENETGAALEACLDRDRRIERETRFLEAVARSGPQAEVVWNMDDVRQAVDEIAALGIPKRSEALVREIMERTQDEETRAACQRALESLDTVASGMQ